MEKNLLRGGRHRQEKERGEEERLSHVVSKMCFYGWEGNAFSKMESHSIEPFSAVPIGEPVMISSVFLFMKIVPSSGCYLKSRKLKKKMTVKLLWMH